MQQNFIRNINLYGCHAISLTDNKSESVQKAADITMEAFLKDIEKRAYHMAVFACGTHADALDLLQDSMIKLVTNYKSRPSSEWKPLFYKILQNKIRDWQRHQKVRNLAFFWKSNTLEWTAPIERMHGNWPGELPVVKRWAYDYSKPGADEDFIPQTVPLEEDEEEH